MSAGRFVGQRVPRREDRRLVTGHGTYIANTEVAGMLHARFVRSDRARGLLRGIDTSEAELMPGVVAE